MPNDQYKTFAVWSPRPDAAEKTPIAADICLYGLPALELVEKPWDVATRQALLDAEVLIFVSHHAVTCCLSRLSPAEINHLNDKVLVAIGLRTAEALSNAQLRTTLIAPPPFNSEALLRDKTFLALPYQYFAIVCGVGGRTLLHSALVQSGKCVQRIECYQRDKANLSAQVMVKFISEYAIGGIILSSNAVAEAVAAHLLMAEQQQCFALPVFVLSERIGERAKQLGFREVVVAKQADKNSLYQSMTNWWEGRLQ